MLTTEPGPDVAPYHDRQIVILRRDDWAKWLDPEQPSSPLLKPLPEGSLEVVESPREGPVQRQAKLL
jgi:putative SOS response-associated peptidase YedK